MTAALAIDANQLAKEFKPKGMPPVQALAAIDLQIPQGTLSCMVGPDGAGKTTFLRLLAGLMPIGAGRLSVLGIDSGDAQAIQERISYMPQRFGLYEDLTVQENLDLYADLHGVPVAQRRARYEPLMEMTDLAAFTARPAGKLSGGMKQKLGLACTLVRSPGLLLLDEPTAGVDPRSRRELWTILHGLVDRERLTVFVTTAYLDEAESCSKVIVLDRGRILESAAPQRLRERAADRVFLVATPPDRDRRIAQAALSAHPDIVLDAVPQAGATRVVLADKADRERLPELHDATPIGPRLEDGFMVLLKGHDRIEVPASPVPAMAAPPPQGSAETVIEVKDLVKRFGDFTAVDNTTFEVRRGEIFGLLGPNGAGKTTTFRMLCGLLPSTSGTLRVAGVDLRKARSYARQRVGYVSQKFSLYRNLTVRENLEFFGSCYGVRGERLQERYQQVLADFDLQGADDRPSGELPGGFKQRLAMAAALLHEPDILFLDEPTSGTDPLARREFWQRITALAQAGVTVIITTHFMEEAEYCDRIVIQDAGRVLALGTPLQVREQASPDDPQISMEEAFIRIVEKARTTARPPAS